MAFFDILSFFIEFCHFSRIGFSLYFGHPTKDRISSSEPRICLFQLRARCRPENGPDKSLREFPPVPQCIFFMKIYLGTHSQMTLRVKIDPPAPEVPRNPLGLPILPLLVHFLALSSCDDLPSSGGRPCVSPCPNSHCALRCLWLKN